MPIRRGWGTFEIAGKGKYDLILGLNPEIQEQLGFLESIVNWLFGE